MLKRFRILDGKVVPNQDSDEQIMLFVKPDDKEKKYLINNLKVDEHTLNSALDPDENPRLEFEPEHLALIFKTPRNYSGEGEQFLFKISSSGIFLFKKCLIVIRPEETPLFEEKYFSKVKTLTDVMLRLIFRTTYHYLEHLKIFHTISDSLEAKINTSMENKYLINLFGLEKSLVYYLNAINTNAMVIEKLKINSSKIGFTQENIEFLDDLIIENTQCYKEAEIYSNILAALMDARVSIVSNNLNVLMKTLNIIIIGIMVPTFVVSAFSMNVHIPFQSFTNAFWIIMSLAATSVILFMIFWKYKKW